ncbi:SdrD B-like domain-containing protein [Larkinella sp.]|uniref:SdrD B-like domain-containing protein n=1 Tax=Larkinella sp. TaxID=2034517 RepID=UPI003BAC8365
MMNYLSTLVLFLYSSALSAQISGRVWQDANTRNGTKGTERPVSSVAVMAYGTDGRLIAQTTTGADGTYQLVVPPQQPVRLEFGNLEKGWQPVANTPLVRFATTPAEVNLVVQHPANQLGANPRLVQTVYVNGDYGDAGADSLTAVAITAASSDPSTLKRIATPRQVGSLWGLAYDRTSQRLYAAALAKRHAGFGPLGSGGIYRLSPDDGTVLPFINLDALGFATAPANLKRDLGSTITRVSHDSLMFSLVGKCSLGGLDVTDDGQMLFVMNLYDRALYTIRLPADGALPQPADVKKFTLPLTAGQSGDARPFAVKIHNDQVYVGVVEDASHSKRVSELRAIVYRFDPNADTPAFSEVFSTALNYPRGILDYGVSGWQPWTDDYRQARVSSAPDWLIYPQPILADIEFDTDGSMILGLMDRLGHQTGDGQLFRPNSSMPLMPYRGLSGGDVLRVAFRDGRYELERNGGVGDQQSAGRNNRQGPTGGEFYHDDHFQADGIVWHQETAMGGLALLPEQGQLVVAAREPVPGQYVTGGFRWFANQTGNFVRGLAVFPGGEKAGYFWKTNNVGDVEVIADPPPLTLGNRVWHDRNANGQQDADEPGLPAIQVTLYRAGKLAGQTQTDQEGYYAFDNQSVAGGLQPLTDYEIRVPLQQTVHLGLSLPAPDRRKAVATSQADQIDNDAILADQTALIRLTTPAGGGSMTGLDIGLECGSCAPTSQTAEPERLTLTPNPAGVQTAVRYRGYQQTGALMLTVLDLQGKPLMTTAGNLTDHQYTQTLNLTRLTSGHYFVTVSEGDQTTTVRFVKH